MDFVFGLGTRRLRQSWRRGAAGMLGTTAQGPDIYKGAGSLDPCRHVLAQEEKRLPLAAVKRRFSRRRSEDDGRGRLGLFNSP